MFSFVYLICYSFDCLSPPSPPQEDQDAGLSVGQRKRVKLSSSTKGKCNDGMIDLLTFISPVCLSNAVSCLPLDPCIIETLKHKCFLEELLFWTIKYEFPQKMVTFLLNMLPDQDYKVPIVHLSHGKVFFFLWFSFPFFFVSVRTLAGVIVFRLPQASLNAFVCQCTHSVTVALSEASLVISDAGGKRKRP